MGRISTLTLGSFVLKEPVAIFPSNAAGVLANPQIAGILGNGVLKRFHVIFDWPHQRMLLAPGPDVNMRSPANCSGLSLRVAPPDYHRLLVNGVIAGSPAAQAGILAGDLIEAVARGTGEPRPDAELQLALVRAQLEEPGHSFIVLIDRGGKPMQVKFVTRELYYPRRFNTLVCGICGSRCLNTDLSAQASALVTFKKRGAQWKVVHSTFCNRTSDSGGGRCFLGGFMWNAPWNAMRYIGTILVAVGVGLHGVARFQLGKSFSATAKAHELVTHGLYSKIRNPIYVFSVVAVIGLLLVLQIPALWIVLVPAVIPQVIPRPS